MAGPSITLAYLLGGGVIFLIMRALGEMSCHSPVSGAFSDYTLKNWGPFGGFEFRLAISKVVAIVAMIGLGAKIIFVGAGNDVAPTGFCNLWAHGGYFPHGLWGMITAL